jgi:SHS2 domain-containing protein
MLARWSHFEHDADIGVRGEGSTKEEAFEQAALALTAVLTDSEGVHSAKAEAVRISRSAPDDELLLVGWLNALVYEMATRKMIFGRFEVHIQGHDLQATVCGESVDISRHQPAVEIKGATFTGLRVAQTPDRTWIAECIVDV